MQPSTGRPIPLIASVTIAAWRGLPTRLQMTPAMFSAGSNARQPSAMAPALRAILPTSNTRITGAASSLATSALLPVSDLPSKPSNSPMTPSMTAISASRAARAKVACTVAGVAIQVSRLREGRPVAAA
ncbi:MAG: hypothetical protein BWY52_03313 [Chloroflexi bacterium ADurb.Bin325]|nr:MAG: hypothetical protein BWY52_03313 [Chloroflexi bacterium ADurb.Bin325]